MWEVEFRFSRKVRTSKIRNLSGKLERRGKNLLLSRKDKGRTLERPPRKMEIKSPLKVRKYRFTLKGCRFRCRPPGGWAGGGEQEGRAWTRGKWLKAGDPEAASRSR